MNKQELIDILKKYKNGYQEETDGYFKGAYGAYGVALGLAKKLDEQPKVTVPQFVADWFEKNKDDLDFAIYAAVAHSIKESDYYRYPEGFIEWIELADNKPIETIIRMKDGYEVEKEPLYQIELPGTSWGAYLTKADNGDLVIFQNTTSGSAFNESEIKAIDERYWAFAVPVEEVK